jgi:hypothetical protein
MRVLVIYPTFKASIGISRARRMYCTKEKREPDQESACKEIVKATSHPFLDTPFTGGVEP